MRQHAVAHERLLAPRCVGRGASRARCARARRPRRSASAEREQTADERGPEHRTPCVRHKRRGYSRRRMTDRIVHLHVGRSVHPVYREQLAAVPPGFRYRFVHPHLADASAGTRRIVEQGARFAGARAQVRSAAMHTLARAGYVRRSTPRINPDVDLIHSAQFFLRTSKPYVVDFEQIGTFALWQPRALDRPWARERLRRMVEDEHCKHLLPWSDAARDGLFNVIGPTAEAHDRSPRDPRANRHAPQTRGDGPLRVLFVGTAFYEKGGVEAMRAASRGAQRPARHHQLRPARGAGPRRRHGPRARPARAGRAPVRRVPRAAVPVAHGHVRLRRARGDGERPAGARARPSRAQRADRRRQRRALPRREHALRRRRPVPVRLHEPAPERLPRGAAQPERGLRRRDRRRARSASTPTTTGSRAARSRA